MGLPRAAVHLLLSEATRTKWSGTVASLGRQHVYLTSQHVIDLSKRVGHALPNMKQELHRDPNLRALGYISDDALYEALGFQESVRIDRSNYERAEVTLDLNQNDTPGNLRDRFDLVLDSGTVEHIFNIGNALGHCLNMAKPGGRIIHLTPTSNAVNHGFFSVSPALYADFYRASGCLVERLWLCRMGKDFLKGTWRVYDCLSSDRNWLPIGRLDGSIWLTYAVILKQPGASPCVPQQSFYIDTWETDQEETGISNSPTEQTVKSSSASKADRLLRATSRWPWVNSVCAMGINRWRHWIGVVRELKRGLVPYQMVGRF